MLSASNSIRQLILKYAFVTLRVRACNNREGEGCLGMKIIADLPPVKQKKNVALMCRIEETVSLTT